MNGENENGAPRLVPLSVADKPVILSLLRLGFPKESEQVWEQGFARIQESTQLQKEQIALALEVDGQFEGIILTLRCQPDWIPAGHTLVNLSSWYVSESARSHAIWMLRKVTRAPNSIFLDLSPTEGVIRLSALMKFRPLNDDVVRIWLLRNLFAGNPDNAKFIDSKKVIASLEESPFLSTVEEHLANGFLVFGLQVKEKVYPLLFRRTAVRGLPIGLTLYYCSDISVLLRNISAVAQGLAMRGWMQMRFDRVSELPPTLKYSVWSNRVRMATAGYPEGRIDFLDTESSIFGFD